MIVFPFSPNWKTPVLQTFAFKTDILRADDRSEQRRSLRQQPRLTYEYNFLKKGFSVAQIEMLLRIKNNQDIVLPEWPHGSRITSGISSGSTVIGVDTTFRPFRVGEFAVLYYAYDAYELVELGSVSDDTIVLANPLVNSWPLGTKIYPAVIGRLPFSMQIRRHTSDIIDGKLTFAVNPGSISPYLSEGTPALTYDGLEITTKPFNWRVGIVNEYSRDLRELDTGIGRVQFFEKDSYSSVSRQVEWLLKAKTELAEFYQFIMRRRGQAKSFWVPSWHRDFQITTTTGSGELTIKVKGVDAVNLLTNDVSQDRLRIRLTDGTTFYKRITNLSADGLDTIVTIDSSFGVPVGPANVKAIDWLLRCRLASDEVVLPWLTSNVANPILPITTVSA